MFTFNAYSQLPEILFVTQPDEIVKCFDTPNEHLDFLINLNLTQYDYYVQWYKENNKFGNLLKNETRLLFPNLNYSHSAKYKAEIIVVNKGDDQLTNILKQQFSEDVLVYVITKTEIIKQPKTVEKINIDDKVEFSFEAHIKGLTGTKNNNEVIIEWFKGSKKLTDDKRIIGTKSSNLSISKVKSSDFGLDYRVVVTGECGTDTSDYFGIMQMPFFDWTGIGIQDRCAGDEFKLYIIKTISDGSPIVNQWYKNGKVLVDGPGVRGSNTGFLYIILYKNDTIQHEIISLKYGISEKQLLPNALHLAYLDSNTKTPHKFGFYVNEGPIVYKQPQSIKIKENESGEFRFHTDVLYGTKYQWYKNGSPWGVDYIGKGNIYSAKKEDSGEYYCVATNNCFSVTSDTITVEVEESAYITNIEDELNATGCAIYPNPIVDNSSLIIDIKDLGEIKIEVYSITGEKIVVFYKQTNIIGKSVFELDLGKYNLQTNTYLINIITPNKTYNKLINYIKY